jgi:hypothetical protein
LGVIFRWRILFEDLLNMFLRRYKGQPRPKGTHGGVGLYVGGVEIELVPIHEAGLNAELHDMLKEAEERFHSVPAADLREAAVVGQGLIEVVAQVPAVSQIQVGRLHEVAFGDDSLEEGDEVELEEDYRVDGWPAHLLVAVAHELTNKGEI